MKKYIATYGSTFDYHPSFFREGDCFYLPMIEHSYEQDVIYVRFYDCRRINQICFKCLIVENDLLTENIISPINNDCKCLWSFVKVLAVAPIGEVSLHNSILKKFGLQEPEVSLFDSNLLLWTMDITNNPICEYLDEQFAKCTDFEHMCLLNKQLSDISLRIKKDSNRELTYSKRMMPFEIMFQEPKDSEPALGEFVLRGKPHCRGHFIPYMGIINGEIIDYGLKCMSFSYSIPGKFFLCEIYERKGKNETLSWSNLDMGAEFTFGSLEHMLPFCLWLVDLNLQGLCIEDIYNLSFVQLPTLYPNNKKHAAIIENAFDSYNRLYPVLTPQTRKKIIEWFYNRISSFDFYPACMNEPNIILRIKKYVRGS